MDLKELETKLEGLKDKFEAKADEIAEGKSQLLKKALETQIEEMKSSLENFAKAEDTKEIKEQLNALDSKLNAKKTQEVKQFKSFAEAFMDAYNEKKEDILALENKKSGTVMLEIKAPINVGLSNTLYSAGSESQVSVTTDTGIISPVRSRLLTYLQSGVNVGSLTGNKAMWVEETDEQGTPIPVAELATKPNISVIYVEKEAKVEKFPAYTKVSTELMADAPQLVSAVQSNVLKRINIAIENSLFVGNGTSNALNGLASYATAFTGGTLNGTLPAGTANNYDVIRALALQVYEAFGIAGAVFVDAGKLAEMELDKANDGQYILPPFKSADGTTIAGVRLIPTTAFVGDATIDFVGGDLSVINVLFREGLNIQIDRSGDDFINNMMTILAETRLVQFVSGNDTGVLVKGAFDAAKTALNGV
jgi:HK97 family phage major capsid protein